MKFGLRDRELRKILKQVDKQRVVGILTSENPGIRPWPMVEYGIPYGDERFACGLLTCEFRGWVESFGEEIEVKNMTTGKSVYQQRYRVTQAGRAVLDRTQTVANAALLVSAMSVLISILALSATIRNAQAAPPIQMHSVEK
jgi:hypothetical protein